jgi:hypothetical protein
VKDVNLPELNTALTNFNLQISSNKEDDTEQVSTNNENSVKVSFDSEIVTLTFMSIFIDGSGMNKDPDSKNLEVISFRAPISSAQVILNPEEVYKDDGSIYPKFNVKNVKISIDY